MDAAASPARSHPAVVISVVVAATAVTACALVAIAYMMGWVPARAGSPKPGTAATSTAPQAATGADLALLPGESVVGADEPAKSAATLPAPAAVPKPVAPRYSAGKPPEPAPRASTRPAAPAPRTPPRVTSYERSARNLCVNCGTVTAITAFDMGEWDVKVRFEDGTTQTLHYRTRPPLRIGQSVLLEDGRLIPQ
jgi:hypothetical protein